MKRLKDNGLSLIELLVAFAIFGMLFGGLFMLLQQENRLVKHSADLLTARLLANEAMETLKVYPFDQLETYPFTHPDLPTNMNVQIFVSPFGSETLKKLMVTVRWVDLQDRKQSLTLATLRSRYSPGKVEGGK